MSEQRPTRATSEMKLAAALSIAKDLVKSCDFDNDETSIAYDIATHCSQSDDGYECGKELERRASWVVDFATCEVLDGYSSTVRSEITKAEKEWGKTAYIEALPLGAKIRFGRNETGTITGLYEYGPFKYLVLEEGKSTSHNGRRIVNFEDATICAESEAK